MASVDKSCYHISCTTGEVSDCFPTGIFCLSFKLNAGRLIKVIFLAIPVPAILFVFKPSLFMCNKSYHSESQPVFVAADTLKQPSTRTVITKGADTLTIVSLFLHSYSRFLFLFYVLFHVLIAIVAFLSQSLQICYVIYYI